MNFVLNTKFAIFGLVLSSVVLANTAHAAQIDYFGQAQAADLTAIPFVLGSTMWGAIETGAGTGIAASGLNSLNGLDPSKFTFTFGDLELTSYQIPSLTTAGFEIYSEGDASQQPVKFFYDGGEWAKGTVNYFRINVENSLDFNATGLATANLTSAGAADDTFFNEVMSLTGGSGLLTITVDEFFPVDNLGLFSTSGTIIISPVPLLPAGWLFVSGLLGLIGISTRKKAA